MLFLILFLIAGGGIVCAVRMYGRTELIKEVDCTFNVNFDITDSGQMKDYLLSGTWTYQRENTETGSFEEKVIFIKLTDNLFYSTTDRLYLQEEAILNLEMIHSGSGMENKDLVLSQQQTPLFLTDHSNWSEEILGMDQESFTTLVSYNTKDWIRYFITKSDFVVKYRKNEITKVNFDGTYIYKGKTLIIQEEDLYHEEADKHYRIHQKDNQRLYVDGQVISEVPSYHFWIDEEGNLILFSEGMKIAGLEHQKIIEEYPFYILEKQK